MKRMGDVPFMFLSHTKEEKAGKEKIGRQKRRGKLDVKQANMCSSRVVFLIINTHRHTVSPLSALAILHEAGDYRYHVALHHVYSSSDQPLCPLQTPS